MKILKTMLACTVMICLVACTGSTISDDQRSNVDPETGVTTVGNPTDNDPTKTTTIANAVKEVMPVFKESGSSQALAQASVITSWGNGNPLYDVFYILREFDPQIHQGVIDTSNLYKTMWESRNFGSRTEENCLTITEQVITPPFDFGNEAVVYNCAYNEDTDGGYDFGGAINKPDKPDKPDKPNKPEEGGDIIRPELDESADVIDQKGLFGFVWVGSGENPHNEYGVMQTSYNTVTYDLSVDIAIWVDYTNENDYCYRNDIDGNTDTHLFAFRSIRGHRSIVGKGYSQGEGKHFLLKIDGRYYCVAAGAGEAELKAMDAHGSETVDTACADHQIGVDAMMAFSPGDLACASSDLNPGGTGTAAEGTIFLRYE